MVGASDEDLHSLMPFLRCQYKSILDKMYAGEQVEDFESAEWYHGPISRQDTEMLLKVCLSAPFATTDPHPNPPPPQRDNGGWDGWFLVRISTKEANTFVVTYHNQVKYADGVYSTHKDQGNHQYNSLQELVKHHTEGRFGFQVVLTKPCKKLK